MSLAHCPGVSSCSLLPYLLSVLYVRLYVRQRSLRQLHAQPQLLLEGAALRFRLQIEYHLAVAHHLLLRARLLQISSHSTSSLGE